MTKQTILAGADIHAGGGYEVGTEEECLEFLKKRVNTKMTDRIKKLMAVAGTDTSGKWMGVEHAQKFAQLVVSEVLDEVAERTYYSGDRTWSDDLDRKWIEMEFGFGELVELKK